MTKESVTEEQLRSEIKRLRSELAIANHSTERTANLYKTEERFALAMRGANDGLWDWDLVSNEVYYSPRWKSMLGYAEDELTANLRTWELLVHPQDKSFVWQQVQAYLSDETSSFEVEMRMQHKAGHYAYVRCRGFKVSDETDNSPLRLIGTHVDISEAKKAELFEERHNNILEMIAKGKASSEIYDEIALLYEERYSGIRCSMLELVGNKLKHGGAPSLPQAYCDAVDGLEYGPNVGSCGTATYTGKRVIVEDIETDPKWSALKDFATPHGMRCCWSQPIFSTSGEVIGAFGMYYDFPAVPTSDQFIDMISAARLAGIVMEREKNQKLIRDLAFVDQLTGLASRSHFCAHIENLTATSIDTRKPFSLLYIDLDNFKHINDSLGHDVGDHLLQAVAARLKEALRPQDYIARLSGDEFCIIVDELQEDGNAGYVAERCIELVAQPVELAGRRFIPGCSIGIAHFPEDGTSLPSLLKAADTAMYVAKAQGKNCYVPYERQMTVTAEHQFKVGQYLREAIENQGLSLVYQPQVKLSTGEIIGVEALCRWEHPKLGSVSPVEFIEIAEQIGMIKPLTEWVLRTACHQAKQWKLAGYDKLCMAVNISPSHFLDSDLVPLICQVLAESGLEAQDLELEVTEGVVQTNQQNLVAFEQVNALGVLLAIDDFGTGFSSFASLKHLDVDILKIDKCFIDDMLNDNKAKLLVQSMIEMGHNLGYTITAEGVECEAQLALLQDFKCDIVQGYLFSRPVVAADISALLTSRIVAHGTPINSAY